MNRARTSATMGTVTRGVGAGSHQCGASARAFALWLACLCAASSPTEAKADLDACLGAHEQAQLHRLNDRYVEAREQLLACAARDCPDVVRADCSAWLTELESILPSVIVVVVDAAGNALDTARVSTRGTLLSERCDGRALALNQGAYQLLFEADGYVPQEQALVLRSAEQQRIVRVTLLAVVAPAVISPAPEVSVVPRVALDPRAAARARPEDARPMRLRRSAYLLGGLAGLSLATGAGLAAAGKHQLDALRSQGCRPGCDEGQVRHGRRMYLSADVAFGVAGALFSAAVVTFVLGHPRQGGEQRSAPQLTFGPRAGFLAWAARF